jgi:epoxyqueuosine reductase QueG
MVLCEVAMGRLLGDKDTVILRSGAQVTAAAIIRSCIPHDDDWIYGFADLSGRLPAKLASCPFAVSLGRRLEDGVVDTVAGQGPTEAYYRQYIDTNQALNRMTAEIARALASAGIPAIPIPATLSDEDLSAEYHRTLAPEFSHKMAATCAGLGWIGKTALLVTEAFGPRLRLATVLVSQRLPRLAEPVTESKCGNCALCVEQCPAQAATGVLWRAGDPREKLLDAFECRATCRQITARNLGRDESLCGLCLQVCPVGKRRDR